MEGEAKHGSDNYPVLWAMLTLVLMFAFYYSAKACMPSLLGCMSSSMAAKRTYSNMVVNAEDLAPLTDDVTRA